MRCQHHTYLTAARINYIADFSAFELATGNIIFFEAKGVETPSWRIKRRLWEFYGPGELRIYKGNHVRPFLFETIVPKAS